MALDEQDVDVNLADTTSFWCSSDCLRNNRRLNFSPRVTRCPYDVMLTISR